jgi:hypothetical protein
MEDILKREIDKMSKALTSILLSLAGFKNIGNNEAVINYANESLKSKLNLSLSDIIDIPDDIFISTLISGHQLNDEHLSILADILFNVATARQIANQQNYKPLFNKALMIYKHLSTDSKNYSFAWHSKINQINKII